MRKVSSARGKVAKAADARTPPKRASVKNNSLAENDADSSDVDEQPLSSLLHPRNEDNENRLSGDAVPGALSDSTEAESFEVESILSSRVRHGKQQFKIRWKGYGPADDTWEDEECIDSPDLIAAYLKGPPDETKAGKTKSPKPKAKGVKRNASASSEKTAVKKTKGNGDGTEEYEVTKIVDDVLLKDGTRQFLVRWKGFTSKENTWEPEANLNCPELIQKYLELQENREGTDRETRTERKQVYKYNPELTKRRSHRSTKSEVDDTSTYHYQQRGDSPYSILDSRSRSSSWNSSQGSYNISDSLCMEKSNSWYSNVSSKCSIM